MNQQENYIILGLGSNLGNKLANLRRAFQLLKAEKKIQIISVAPVYQSDAMVLPTQNPQNNPSFFNTAIKCKARLSPQKLLKILKLIEHKMGREKNSEKWAARIIDIDILVHGSNLYQDEFLTIPHPGLYTRPFALFPLTDILPQWFYFLPDHKDKNNIQNWGSRFTGEAPFHTKQIANRIDTPIMYGILNITPDSFSDGNNFYTIESAVSQTQHLIATGADIIDIGAESTRPGALQITPNTEWERLQPTLIALHKQVDLNYKKISLDTKNAITAKRAIDEFKIHIVNDVTAGYDKDMLALIAHSGVKYIFMHSLTVPPQHEKVVARNTNIISELLAWAQTKIAMYLDVGIKLEQLIFDPGIGFGKSQEQSLLIVKYIKEFKQLPVPILLGHSRKSFLQLLTNAQAKERDFATAAMAQHLKNSGVDYLRVHNVGMCLESIKYEESLR